jgi:hypothetical protein
VLLPHLRDRRPRQVVGDLGIWAHSDDDVVAELARLLRDVPDAPHAAPQPACYAPVAAEVARLADLAIAIA